MADDKLPNSPIADVDGDGKLTGKDILAKLKAENERENYRTPNEKAHGILENVGIIEIKQNLGENPDYEKAAQEFVANLKTAIEDITRRMKDDPNYAAQLENDTGSFAGTITDQDGNRKSLLNEGEREIMVANDVSVTELAKAFAKTFPKGVEISAEDMKEILEHFQNTPGLAWKDRDKGTGIA